MVNHVAFKQLLVTLGASAVGFAFGSWPGCSVLIGGLVSSLVNTYAAFKVLGARPEAPSASLLVTCYFAEMIKIVFAAVALASLFALVEQLNALALFAGFLAVHVGGTLWAGASGPMARSTWLFGRPGAGGRSQHKMRVAR